jgi:hypothetical protein
MSMNAKFIADFSSFYAAVQKAEVKLADFQKGAGNVEKSLNRMVDSFSGRQVIQQATLMEKAIGGLEGVSKLTASEMRRVNTVMTEAVEKFKALGQTAPANMQKMADATKSAESAMGGFGKQVLTTAAGFVTAQAIIGAVTGVVKALVSELKTITVGGAAVADVSENFGRLSANAGHLGDVLLGTLRAGTHSTITDFEFMKTVNQDLAAGMNLTDRQFGTLAKGAFALAQATGGDVKTALDTMNDAMLTGRTRALALLTGKIDLEAAETKYAASLGTTRDRLSEEEKLEAARAAILDAVSAATARLGEQADGLDERIAQAATAWANFENELGQSIATSDSLGRGLDALRTSLADAFGGNQAALIQQITDAVEQTAKVMVDLGLATIEMGRVVHTVWSGVSTAVLGTITGIVKSAEAMLATIAVVAKVGEVFGQVQKGTSAWATGLRQDLKGVSDSLASQTREAALGVVGMSALDKKFDEMGGVLFRVKDALSAARKETTAFVGPLQDVAAGHDDAGAAARRHGALTRQTAADIRKATTDLAQMHVEILKIENVLPGLSGSFGHVDDSVVKLGPFLRELVKDLSAVERHGMSVSGVSTLLAGDLEKLGEHIDAAQIHEWAQEWAFVGPLLADAGRQAQTFEQQLSDMARSLTQLAQVSGDSFGGIVKDIAELVVAWDLARQSVKAYQEATTKAGKATAALGMATAFASATRSGQGKLKGAMSGAITGAAIGSVIPGIGTAVGALAGALVGLARNWGGVSKAEKEARAEVEKFSQSIRASLSAGQLAEAGGEAWKMTVIGVRDAYLATGHSAAEAEAAVAQLWAASAEGAEAVAAAMDPINKAFALQQAATDALIETTSRYQFSIEELGPAFARQELSKQAQQLYKDWQVLSEAGIDIAAIGREMGDSIQKFVNEAVKTGTEVDPAMRPMLQKMIDMGLLTDAAGKKIENLEDSGISFAMTMSEGFKTIVDSVKELTDTIRRGLGLAIDDTTKKIKAVPDVHVRVRYDDPGPPSGEDKHQGGTILPFVKRAHRGLAIGEVPIIAQVGEGILSRGAMRRIGGPPTLNRLNAGQALRGTADGGGGGAGEIVIHTHVHLDEKQVAESVDRVQMKDQRRTRRLA